ncbi:MAG: Asp-tRNA(Asn)/Glu-tRNA(Gln) amidotransferase subunit GatB [Chitinispirillaceae bacterium]|nr:Asp-tRNA(Asn)/Glu-tRNA(Gln) amidotransferase subunit GatB [Chitinispirillaceae bacterium]
MEYEVVIGLEVHAQLLTKTKLFCGCTMPFGEPPNTHGCPVCLGLPGALPVLNRTAVDMAIRTGLAVGCAIAPKSVFARKNYFYPDLPKGYQISQYDMPICIGGSLIVNAAGKEKKIGITRIHIEEDAGKLVHDQGSGSLFDVNRCGTPLIEIVSEPDMRSPAEAYAYLTSLKRILEYLGVCDCNMEEGSLRCDANISIRPCGQEKLGTKVELKNMNSFRSLEKALVYEAARQEEVLRSGGAIHQQTFLWDPDTNRSAPMRSKEDAHDYRYFPDPDLVPLVVEQAQIDRLRKTVPELPEARKNRFREKFRIVEATADVLISDQALADYFEAVISHGADPKTVANWVMGEILRIVKDQKIEPGQLRITPVRLATLLKKVADNTVSGLVAKKVLDLVQADDKDPETIISENGLSQVSDAGALEAAVRQIIDNSPNEVARYRSGDKKLAGFFVGQAVKLTGGKGNPREISGIVMKLLA